MSNFWKLVAMGVTAAAAFVIAKEVVERHEKGEDISPKAVLKGLGRKASKFFEEKCGCYYEDDFDDFDDFEDFELDDDDDDILEFGTDDMESDQLTDDGYILEFSAEEEEKPAETPAPEAAPENAGEAPEAEAEDEE
ncbi:MAG: hypothetical protein IJM51_10085 [Clostridia bacterium]|nr:hypothetical protein [Clostridia bacterium]